MIPKQTVVRRPSGRLGVVVWDEFDCCTPEETAVVFDGGNYAVGVPTAELEVVGPEGAVATMEGCGGGRGAECCIFMVIGPDGLECQRFGRLRNTILLRTKTMNAQRNPVALYPGCLLGSSLPPE